MTCTVRHISDEVQISPFRTAQKPVHGVNEHFDDIDVLPLVEPADVVRLRDAPLVEDDVDGPRVVLHVEPVPHILSLPVYRQRFSMPDVVDEQRDQFLGELVGAVVVTAVGNNGGHSKRIVESSYKVVGAGLGGRVRAVRLVLEVFREELLTIGQVMRAAGGLGGERGLNAFRMRHLQGSIHLIRGDVIEAFALIFLREALPIGLGGLKQAQRTHHIGLRKSERILDGAVHMAFGREVNDTVHLFFLHQFENTVKVADVHLHEPVVGLVLNILEIGQISSIRKFIQINNLILRILIYK